MLMDAAGMDHPRACGEKSSALCGYSVKLGSPPRMRGKALREALVNNTLGITPAHAGKSKNFTVYPVTVRDHPRACGEKNT